MRAILHGFHEPMHAQILDRLIADLDLRYLQTTYSQFRPQLPPSTKGVLHHWWDLNWADYHVDWTALRPLDEQLLSELAGAETAFLKMADRLEQAAPQSYQERKNLYLKHVRYWNHVLLEEDIDFYLGLNIPHETWDFVLYSLCQLHGVPTILGLQTQVPDTIVTVADWERNAEAVGRRYAELAAARTGAGEDELELAGRFRRDFEAQTQKKKPTPFYMNAKPPAKGPSLRSRLAATARFLRDDPSLVRTKVLSPGHWLARGNQMYEARQRAQQNREMLAAWDALSSEPDLDRPFIYLALHYQPEMTTSPLAGAFVDQVLIAELLAATMPGDVRLYIKEHPMQRSLLGRHAGYYDELRRLPRTTLVRRDFDTFELTSRCRAVATATGTVGWEALFREKPVLLFGHNFYQHASGVFMIRSADDARAAMQRIFTEGFHPTRRELKLFLQALADTTSEGYLSSEYGKVSQVTPAQNAENVIQLLTASVRSAVRERNIYLDSATVAGKIPAR